MEAIYQDYAPRGVRFFYIYKALAHPGYDGYVTVHQAYAELMGPDEAAVESAAFLRTAGEFEPATSS